jgi:hypothetical protein
VSTRREMPAQVFPPEGFGSCAIAAERFTALSKAKVAPASNRVFISVLRTAVSPFNSARQIDRRRASQRFGEATLDAKT